MSRAMIAAPSSGSGKTIITCAVLGLLKRRGADVRSYKCGPDYIDPMFHTEILGIPSENIDPFIMGDDFISVIDESADISVIEGVMGYYDGLGGISETNSSFDIAGKTGTPVILVVDCKGRSVSAAAEVCGFLNFKGKSHIKGVILNRVSPMIYQDIKKQIEFFGVKVLGFLPYDSKFSFESRHLGLITPAETENICNKIKYLCDTAEKYIDLNGILEISRSAVKVEAKQKTSICLYNGIKLAVAKDKAFCFYYKDNIRILEALGAEILYFSPMYDEKIPDGANGLILGGGYPEIYVQCLSENKGMLKSVKESIESGMPCLAECGGFLYLHDRLEGTDGEFYTMAGAIHAEGIKTDGLRNFGYAEVTAKSNNLLCAAGEKINIHEYHYWQSTCTENSFSAKKPLRNREYECIYTSENVFAGFPHIHFRQNIKLAKNFIERCSGYRNDIE